MNNIAILASGSGSNAENIINYFSDNKEIDVAVVISNRECAYVLERASKLGVPSLYISNKHVNSGGVLLRVLQEYNIDYIILAGYLQLIPLDVVDRYRGRILNIHPALLPSFGGRGMYGMNVHRAVKEAGVEYTGITIHHVSEQYDKGEYIFQAKVAIDGDMSAEQIAEAVQGLEQRHFPQVIENFINKR